MWERLKTNKHKNDKNDNNEQISLLAVETSQTEKTKEAQKTLGGLEKRKDEELLLIGCLAKLYDLHDRVRHKKSTFKELDDCYAEIKKNQRFNELKQIENGKNVYEDFVQQHLLLKAYLSGKRSTPTDGRSVVSSYLKTVILFQTSYSTIQTSLETSIREIDKSIQYWESQGAQKKSITLAPNLSRGPS